jgi:hypothetical protein
MPQRPYGGVAKGSFPITHPSQIQAVSRRKPWKGSAHKQSHRFCGIGDRCIDGNTVYSRDDRSLLRTHVSRAFRDLVHPDCPQALPACTGRIASRGEAACRGIGERVYVGHSVRIS